VRDERPPTLPETANASPFRQGRYTINMPVKLAALEIRHFSGRYRLAQHLLRHDPAARAQQAGNLTEGPYRIGLMHQEKRRIGQVEPVAHGCRVELVESVLHARRSRAQYRVVRRLTWIRAPPAMTARGTGRIVNVTSEAGVAGSHDSQLDGSSKYVIQPWQLPTSRRCTQRSPRKPPSAPVR
jgi:hypothetical protein